MLKVGQFKRTSKKVPLLCAHGREYCCTIISFLQRPAQLQITRTSMTNVSRLSRWDLELLELRWRLRPIHVRSVVRLTDAEMVPTTWNEPSYHPWMRHRSINFVSTAYTPLYGPKPWIDDRPMTPLASFSGFWRTREKPAVADHTAHDSHLHQGPYHCICHLRRKIQVVCLQETRNQCFQRERRWTDFWAVYWWQKRSLAEGKWLGVLISNA